MRRYRLFYSPFSSEPIIERLTEAGHPFESFMPEDNHDYQAWLAEGNVPEPPLPVDIAPSIPTIEDRLRAAETLINLILDEEDV